MASALTDFEKPLIDDLFLPGKSDEIDCIIFKFPERRRATLGSPSLAGRRGTQSSVLAHIQYLPNIVSSDVASIGGESPILNPRMLKQHLHHAGLFQTG